MTNFWKKIFRGMGYTLNLLIAGLLIFLIAGALIAVDDEYGRGRYQLFMAYLQSGGLHLWLLLAFASYLLNRYFQQIWTHLHQVKLRRSASFCLFGIRLLSVSFAFHALQRINRFQNPVHLSELPVEQVTFTAGLSISYAAIIYLYWLYLKKKTVDSAFHQRMIALARQHRGKVLDHSPFHTLLRKTAVLPHKPGPQQPCELYHEQVSFVVRWQTRPEQYFGVHIFTTVQEYSANQAPHYKELNTWHGCWAVKLNLPIKPCEAGNCRELREIFQRYLLPKDQLLSVMCQLFEERKVKRISFEDGYMLLVQRFASDSANLGVRPLTNRSIREIADVAHWFGVKSQGLNVLTPKTAKTKIK
jgi:hypothetical protein